MPHETIEPTSAGNDSEHRLWDSAATPAQERAISAWPQVLNAVIGAAVAALVVAAVVLVLATLLGQDTPSGAAGTTAGQRTGAIVAVALAAVTFVVLAPVLLTRVRADERLRGHGLAAVAAVVGLAVAILATLLLVGGGALVLETLAHLDGSSFVLLWFFPALAVIVPVLTLPWAASRVYRRRYARLT